MYYDEFSHRYANSHEASHILFIMTNNFPIDMLITIKLHNDMYYDKHFGIDMLITITLHT
jgi:hypothetical protein